MSAAILGGNLAVPVAVRAADPDPVIIGNALVDRQYATDFAVPAGQLGPVLVVIQASPLPGGTLTEFRTWNQTNTGGSPTSSAGNVFIAYVLRPSATPNQYHVIYRSNLHTVPVATNPAGEVATFAAPNVAVETGDLLAFYGEGVPVDVGLGSDTLSYPAPTAPVAGTSITLGTAAYPLFSENRNYSFAASVTPAPLPIGQGFTLNASDIRFIRQQIRIAEAHAATATAGNPCGTMLGTGPNQVSSPLLPFGLRTVDGTCNNLVPGQEEFGAADNLFPRLLTPDFRAAQAGSSYTQTSGTRHRLPAAHGQQPGRGPDRLPTPPRWQPPVRAPSRTRRGTLFIPNIAPDVGLSAPVQLLVHALRPVLRSRPRPRRRRAAAAPSSCPSSRTTRCSSRAARHQLHGADRATNQPGPTTCSARPTTSTTHQHDDAVRRPEPDLHLAPVAPGVPARVRPTPPAAPSPPAG